MRNPLAFTIGLNTIKALRKVQQAAAAAEQTLERPLTAIGESALRRRLQDEAGVSLTFDSVSWSAPVWKEHLADCQGRPGLQALEIGSFEGCSALWFLDNVLTGPAASITCIDPFTRLGGEPRFDHNMRVCGHSHQVTKLKGPSEDLLVTLAPETYDLIFIDGSHRALNVLMDAVASWRLLKVDGVLLFDDYLWHPELPPMARPQAAIDLFLNAFADQLTLLHKGGQVIVRKTAGRPI